MTDIDQDTHRQTLKFTFIEILLASLIVAALAAVITPNFIRCVNRGPVTACKSNLKNIATALDIFAEQNEGRYPDNLAELAPDILKTLPECSSAQYQTYRVTFGPRAPFNTEKAEHYYLLECTGRNHEPFNLPADYPKYSSLEGILVK